MPPLPVLLDGPPRAKLKLVLAHGAGAPMDSPFMEAIAQGLARERIRVIRFEFPYMHARRSGKKRPPDREPVLRETWRRVVEEHGGGGKLFIGGKSMGGRMASLVADELHVRGLVCLGYPFHPPGAPAKTRTEHLRELETPALVVQGTRDPFGKPAEVRKYRLSKAIRVAWIEGGDHSFTPLKSSGRTEDEALAEAVGLVAAFLREVG